jgi:hypothetical protein
LLAQEWESVMFQAYVQRIPRLNLVGALALGRALIAATDLVPRLSEPILRARRLLETRLDHLTARARGHESHPWADRAPIASAGKNLDNAWMALHDWLGAFASLPAHQPTSRMAIELLVAIFPEGVPLVRPPPLLEWAESEARIARIHKAGLDAALRSLGGQPFVETILVAHAHYMETMGNTEGGAWSSRAMKQSLDAVVLAIHAYVTNVIAELFDGPPESTDHASALLGPLDFAHLRGDSGAFFEQTLDAYPPPPPPALEEAAWSRPAFASAV